ncbi:MAG: OmpA family protein [Amylibacter sp.]|nr:OmpA family protein [Amylibacter sp.]
MGNEQTITKIGEDISVQLEHSGYKEILSCVTKECGGYDFRFAIDVVDEPMMRVNLRDYRFITAKQTVNINPAYVTFLLSNSPVSAYVQMTEYHPADVPLKVIGEASTVLEGLTFEAGSTSLGTDPKGALAALAKKLKTEKNLHVFLVGHSDMSGSLEGNTKISQRRAESVRIALINDHGIAPGRLEAHGVGFLSPRATNETEAGAQKNRRVEIVFSRKESE